MDIKKKKEFPYSTVLLLVLVIVPLIQNILENLFIFPWLQSSACSDLERTTSNLRSPNLSHLLSCTLFYPRTLLPITSAHCPVSYFFSWVKSGHSLAQPSLEKSSLHADPTSITSCCVQLHLPSAELHWMGTFPLAFMPIHLHHLLVLYADQILSQETH